MRFLSIIIPAFNEEESLKSTLTGIWELIRGQEWDAEIIVVDDASTDKTAEVAESLSESITCIRTIGLETNCGIGGAVAEGIRQASGQFLLLVPADGQFDPAEIPAFVDELKRFPMVIGIREDRRIYTALRRFQSWIYITWANFLFGQNYPDINWVQGWRKDSLENIKTVSNGVFFLQEMICRFRMAGMKTGMVKSVMRERKAGEAKGRRPAVILGTIWDMLKFWAFEYLPWILRQK